VTEVISLGIGVTPNTNAYEELKFIASGYGDANVYLVERSDSQTLNDDLKDQLIDDMCDGE